MFEYLAFGFAVALVGYLLNRFYFSGGKCNSKKRLDGKTVIITGANSGIGKETAKDLASRGARVILACRNKMLAEKAAEHIKHETSSDLVEVELVDLADLDSVRNFAMRMTVKLESLDLLINNAGIMACPYLKTKDNYEMQFGTNHLGHFLLTNLLLDLLKKSKESRIINVSSMAHSFGKMYWNDLNFEKQNYSRWNAYGQSKLANILFTIELDRRLKGTGITSVSLHPGAVRTELQRYFLNDMNRISPLLNIVYYAFYPFWWVGSKTPVEGAQTTIFCAVDESVPSSSGKYFSDCQVKEPTRDAQDCEAAKRLWDISADLVKL